MPAKPISRRDFIKGAGIAVGAATVACVGLSAGAAIIVSSKPESETEPEPEMPLTESSYGEENMNERILVVYASKGGSTAGVADAIAKSLAESGANVDVRNVASVTDLSPYKAVVIGSAVHSSEWMPEAQQFVERNQETLRGMPTAIFQVCMMMTSDNAQYRTMIPEWLAPMRAKIQPVAEGSFAGALFPDKYPKLSDKLGLRIFLAFIKKQPGDYRDWKAINNWALSLRPLLVQ